MHATISLLLAAGLLGFSLNVLAVEEAEYTVVEREGRFEIRDYAPQILAETIVDAGIEDAGNLAFRKLFRYISGDNRSNTNIAMTAPVSQETSSKIPMTSPVSQEATGAQWAVSFMMPADAAMEFLPTPNDPAVALRAVPARRVVAIRYSGTWSEKRYHRYLKELEAWIATRGLTPAGEPVWARYDPPFMPWFLRRNEILIPVAHP